MKIVGGNAVPNRVILKVKNACYGLHYVQSCCIFLKLIKPAIQCIQTNYIYFDGQTLPDAVDILQSFRDVFHFRE